ncbi:hypothetical protein [Acaryochloris marina]|uniref:Uncharacterized protein n=1 Tax=Acaryochloris marina (strain MBIC 11017) TaxID=329726 RepID=B0CEJ1_ACAM1|nr:hypothetical protein [Acaryochloris marina]ABW26957.1 hypothetical protein AM1_1940 [Acaryochloris marina MBIC11017]
MGRAVSVWVPIGSIKAIVFTDTQSKATALDWPITNFDSAPVHYRLQKESDL